MLQMYALGKIDKLSRQERMKARGCARENVGRFDKKTSAIGLEDHDIKVKEGAPRA
jgi:hypothetical protein